MTPLYLDGSVSVYHGDCLDVIPCIQPFRCVVTDPPYGTKVDRDGYGRRQIHHGQQHIAGDEDLTAFRTMLEVAQPFLLCAFGSPKRSYETMGVMRDCGLTIEAEIVWDKCSPGLGGGIRYQHENIYIAARESFTGKSSLFSVIREVSVSRGGEHPHMKPVPLMLKLLAYLGCDSVLDPFCGTGATLRAAKDMGLSAVGIEVNERYARIAARNMLQECLPFTREKTLDLPM